MPTYEQLVASQQFAHNQNVTAMATGLPLGFGAGFKVTWTAPNLVKVGPGAANVDGEQVSINETTLIDDRMWLVVRNASTHFYIYLTRQGQFEVDITGPIQSVDNDFYNYHPITNARFIGRIFIDSNLDQVFATTGTKSIPEVVVGASTWNDDSDYSCDGTADEEEINAAINYLADAFSGGLVVLASGTFTLGAPIVMKADVVLSGQGDASILERNGNYHLLTITGSSGSEIAGCQIHDLKFTKVSSDTQLDAFLDIDYADRLVIRNVTFQDTNDIIMEINDSDDLLITGCRFIDFGRLGITATTCRGTISDCEFYYTSRFDTDGSGTAFVRGIQFATLDDLAIKGCNFHDIDAEDSGGVAGGIQCIFISSWTAHGVLIEGCQFARITHQGYDTPSSAEGIQFSGAGGTVVACKFAHILCWSGDNTNPRSAYTGTGVFVGSDDAAILSCSFQDVGTAILVNSGSNRTQLSANQAINCGQLIDRAGGESTTAPMLLGETTPSVSGATWARSSDFAYEGTYSYKHTSNAGGGRADFNDNESTTDLHGLVAGVEYTLEAWLYIPTAGGPSDPVNEIELEIGYYDSGAWTFVSASPTATYDTWQKVSVTASFPGSATGGLMRLITSAAVSNGEIFYADNIRAYPTDYQNNHDNLRDDDGTGTKSAANSWD